MFPQGLGKSVIDTEFGAVNKEFASKGITHGIPISDTGKYAREGGDTRNGYILWLEWVNEEHGGIDVGGVCHRAELIMYDDESDADKAFLKHNGKRIWPHHGRYHKMNSSERCEVDHINEPKEGDYLEVEHWD